MSYLKVNNPSPLPEKEGTPQNTVKNTPLLLETSLLEVGDIDINTALTNLKSVLDKRYEARQPAGKIGETVPIILDPHSREFVESITKTKGGSIAKVIRDSLHFTSWIYNLKVGA